MYATAAILAIGATPVFADIDPTSFTMCSESLERCLGPKTSAVVITHLYGRLADLDRLKAIADRHGIPLIEDCAQALGAERAGRKAGTRGVIGCFSFYPTKNLGALGDGGALTTGNDQLADVLRKLRQYGWDKKYSAERPYGRNSRLDELQAAILRIKLGKLDGWNARRREIVARYRAAASPKVSVPLTDAADHVAHLCVVRSKERSALRAFLAARQIGTDIHYPIPDHRQKAVIGMWVERDKLTETEASMDEILTIPCFPEMTDAEVERVANALAEFGGTQGRS
jgi:dTDP-4-amino-4,6-dideoxygalactose transaminase